MNPVARMTEIFYSVLPFGTADKVGNHKKAEGSATYLYNFGSQQFLIVLAECFLSKRQEAGRGRQKKVTGMVVTFERGTALSEP